MMFNKFCVIVFLVHFAAAQEENQLWDLAVAISGEIELLTANGTLVGSALQQFSKLKALTFDAVRHQFLVSDMDQTNDTIYCVPLTKESETDSVSTIVQDLPDDIQGLAIDPISDILYWTDSLNHTINYISLNDPTRSSEILLELGDEIPQDIAVDSCSRYIYWTNSNFKRPSIERATLDGKKRETIVNDNLFMPWGLAIDHIAQRLYWTEKGEGIYYRIESINFDGTDRQLMYEGTHQDPFGIAVGKESIFWTDMNGNALWRKNKRDIAEAPEILRYFKETPRGVVARNLPITKEPDCKELAEAIKNYQGATTEYFAQEFEETTEITQCLNGGAVTDRGCKCRRGYVGQFCEISICYNYCVHGNCDLTKSGYMQCRCLPGYVGSRCEKDMCDDHCLNGGSCNPSVMNPQRPICECPTGFTGARCEKNVAPDELCSLFCEGKQSDVLVDRSNTFVCRCEAGTYTILETSNSTNVEAFTSRQPFEHFQEPSFIILSTCILIMITIIIVLSVMVCRLRRQPRVQKKIVVNKNVTPLTYRPQTSSEQCEITIENCCNMNVCETPCFEPPKLRSINTKKDEKKTLLSNMENGEDLY